MGGGLNIPERRIVAIDSGVPSEFDGVSGRPNRLRTAALAATDTVAPTERIPVIEPSNKQGRVGRCSRLRGPARSHEDLQSCHTESVASPCEVVCHVTKSHLPWRMFRQPYCSWPEASYSLAQTPSMLEPGCFWSAVYSLPRSQQFDWFASGTSCRLVTYQLSPSEPAINPLVRPRSIWPVRSPRLSFL